MFAALPFMHWRRTILAVLAGWLCVLLTAALMPFLRGQPAYTQEVQQLCSGVWASIDTAQTSYRKNVPVAHQALDCSLCLPVLADLPQAACVASDCPQSTWLKFFSNDADPEPSLAIAQARAPPINTRQMAMCRMSV